ncbi:YqaA family protein [Aeromonas salmonicida]|uniref:YqaA family protein n=1 Tax=Aeromonas salmonicida TaxID=645 RepID=UPI001482947B|nr:YqaA family protein [Aeromonas salmonicida]MDR6997037.1 membrane protein YqaA with SNARE-associated domain [Aeromonas salmonicida]HEH9414409.1 DedA family protein [Aeromonas salmonicida]HEH9423925.1 DedA family protein [Aeromonas salmonicida]HEH9437172.1 DedA family protein [Aeromonas salmonicida]
MKLFSRLYVLVMQWARHRYAPYYLAITAFIESVFWPIPVDVMLAPMALAKPHKAWHYATLATIFSVLGAVFGYALGYALWEPLVQPLVVSVGYEGKIALAQQWFELWGIWVIFIASFTPIPYKVFTVTAGLLHMALLPFIVTSLIGRGMRFFLVAGLMRWGGEKMERKLMHYVDVLGWLCIGLAVAAYFWFSR